jgi:hypothetical protein
MLTVKWNPFLAAAVAFAATATGLATPASADVSSTNPAAIVIYPKLVADADAGIDTVLQLTNVSSQPANVRCFYVNANGHCSNDPARICNPNRDITGPEGCSTGASCIPGWIETDFRFRLSPNQPIMWRVSEGLDTFPLSNQPGPGGHFNDQSSIPPASEDPFLGELKCVVVGDDELPIDANWLGGHATIVNDNEPDIAGYNAIGIQAIPGANNRDNTLVLGQEYNGCPNILSLDHFFDDASDPVTNDNIRTNVTFVPCSQDFNLQLPKSLTVQFLVFNEFEQRFSASKKIDCLTDIALSDIDTRLGSFGDSQSIFNVAVQGTLTGQTLARGVNDESENAPGGETILMIAQRTNDETWSAAYVAHQRGVRAQSDLIVLPAAAPTGP